MMPDICQSWFSKEMNPKFNEYSVMFVKWHSFRHSHGQLKLSDVINVGTLLNLYPPVWHKHSVNIPSFPQSSFNIKQGRLNWEEMFLTLPVEFLTHPLAPLSAQLPNPTRITDVCTLQSNLQAKTERYTHEVHVVSMFEKKKKHVGWSRCASIPAG